MFIAGVVLAGALPLELDVVVVDDAALAIVAPPTAAAPTAAPVTSIDLMFLMHLLMSGL
jgi:hypothetical protein